MLKPLLPLLALLALAGCGGRKVEKTDADPALWVVRDDDTTIYLFGTVHVLKPHLSWFDEAVRDALDRSDSLVLELVVPPEAEMARIIDELGTARRGPALPEQLPPNRAKQLRDALDRLGRDRHALDRAEPWLAATTLSILPIRELGYDVADGAENVLRGTAEKAGKPVIGLETAREQFGYFDRLSPAAQRRMLGGVLDGMPRAAATLDATIAAWSRGDEARLASLVNDDLKASPEVERALLIDRNRRWADWIAARMRQPGTVFVAVGAGHLAGPRSVQAELAKRGLEAARINY